MDILWPPSPACTALEVFYNQILQYTVQRGAITGAEGSIRGFFFRSGRLRLVVTDGPPGITTLLLNVLEQLVRIMLDRARRGMGLYWRATVLNGYYGGRAQVWTVTYGLAVDWLGWPQILEK